MADDWDPFADPGDDAAVDTPSLKERERSEAVEYVKPLDEEVEIRIGDIVALHTFPPGAKARCGAVFANGSPERQFGAVTLDLPLCQAVVGSVKAAGLPHLRFDYTGFGRSERADKEPPASGATEEQDVLKAYEHSYMHDDILTVCTYMLENFCNTLAYIGHSGGAQNGLPIIRNELPGGALKVKGICSINCGLEVWQWFMIIDDETKRRFRTKNHQPHMECNRPIVYICGDSDRMTDIDLLEGLILRRKDEGRSAKMIVIPGGDHAMVGHEDEVALKVEEWIRTDILGD